MQDVPIEPVPSASSPHPAPLPPERALAAAERLLAPGTPDRARAAHRFLDLAPRYGIDFSLGRATLGDRAEAPVRQVSLAVPSPGRTAMLFVSGPGTGGAFGDAEVQAAERAACVRAATRAIAPLRAPDGGPLVALAQALPEPGETWAIRAYREAGFREIGVLSYLRRPLRVRERAWGGHEAIEARGATGGLPGSGGPELPIGWRLRSVAAIGGMDAARASLTVALERSYVDTLDCPGLCGLRATSDVIESHRSTGVWSPEHWFILEHAPASADGPGEPLGALLLNPSPETGSVELVYLGLAPGARGKGIAGPLLRFGIGLAARTGLGEIVCAVDQGNTPAMRLYERCGFSERGRRLAFVVAPENAPS
ncbi:MAG: GNAT family N-acetyltransferase [Phycisphaerales bacterium]|nr:MAG: GNAT family N-acetyltransferase [Phycisphaerales bacterium]